MNRLIPATIFLMTTAAALPAAADCLMELDRNRDGLISLDEARPNPKLSTLFTDLDSDISGRLDDVELERFEAIFKSVAKADQTEL